MQPIVAGRWSIGLSVGLSRLWALQKRLNWSRCRLGVNRVGPRRNRVLDCGPDPHEKGQLWEKRRTIAKYRYHCPCAAAMRPFVKLLWQLVTYWGSSRNFRKWMTYNSILYHTPIIWTLVSTLSLWLGLEVSVSDTFSLSFIPCEQPWLKPQPAPTYVGAKTAKNAQHSCWSQWNSACKHQIT